MSLTDLQNASHGSKKTCDKAVKASFFYIKWRGVKPNRTQNGCCKNVCRWELCGAVQSLKEKRGRSGWWKERGRAASQRISHSRPGLSAGGCARGEITGLLPRRSLHRHTATDRKLLAPGRLTDSPRLCHLLFSAMFHWRSLTYTETCSLPLLAASLGLMLVSHLAGFGCLSLVWKF